MYAFLKKRKWLVLLGVLALVGLGTGAKFLYHYERLQRTALRLKDEGIAASQAGEHLKAIDDLRKYLSAHPDDVEALRAYVHSRPLLGIAGDQPHAIQDTIFALRQLVRYETDSVSDRRQLIELCQTAGQDTDVCDEADGLLSVVPNDPTALAAKTAALLRLRKWEQARNAATAWTAAQSTDVQAQMMLLIALQQLHTAPEVMIRRVNSLRAAHPNDPRFEMVTGFALTLADNASADPLAVADSHPIADGKGAAEWFRAAAAHPLPEPTFVRTLVNQFDRLDLFDDSLALLRRVTQAGGCVPIRRDLARRVWEGSAFAELADMSKATAPKADADSEVAALEAVCLRRLGHEAEARKIRDALASRTDDSLAVAWGHILDQPQSRADVQRVMDTCGTALEIEPADAPLHFLRAEFFKRLGNSYLAIAEMEAAASCAPQWAVPLAEEALMHVQRGEIDSAMAAAEGARRRATVGNTVREPSVAVVVARVAAAARKAGRRIDPNTLMDFVRTVQSAIPGEESTREIQISLLAQSGDLDGARAVLKQAIAPENHLDEPTLLRLASLSRDTGLGLEEDCFSASEKQNGLTATLAFQHAVALLGIGKADDGAKLLDQATHDGKDSGSPAWRIAQCSYLELKGDPAAARAWTQLGDALPADAAVQRAVLRSPAAAMDRALLNRTIERLRKLTGDAAMEWRLASAESLLTQPGAGAPQLAQATDLVNAILKDDPDSAEAHLIKSRILFQQGDIAGTKRHLRAASDLDPASPRIAMALVPALSGIGDSADLEERLQRAADGPAPTGELLATLGWLYEKDGSTVNAQALYRRALMLRPNLAPAQNNLAMLLLNSQSPSDLSEAVSLATAATKEQPKNPSYFDTLARAQARSGNLEAAIQAITSAIALAPDDMGLSLSKIEWLVAAGHTDEARSALEQVQKRNGPQIKDVSTQQRIAAIRSSLASTQ